MSLCIEQAPQNALSLLPVFISEMFIIRVVASICYRTIHSSRLFLDMPKAIVMRVWSSMRGFGVVRGMAVSRRIRFGRKLLVRSPCDLILAGAQLDSWFFHQYPEWTSVATASIPIGELLSVLARSGKYAEARRSGLSLRFWELNNELVQVQGMQGLLSAWPLQEILRFRFLCARRLTLNFSTLEWLRSEDVVLMLMFQFPKMD